MPMFNALKAQQEFEKLLSARSLKVPTLGLLDGAEAMFDFYGNMRPSGRVFEQHDDADMLLFQWGTYDWGEGEHFELDLTRQLIFSDQVEDEDIWQLHLTFWFEPGDELRALSRGDKWCETLSALPRFREYVLRSVAVRTCIQHPIKRVVLDYECAG